jgi:hypothetical protein
MNKRDIDLCFSMSWDGACPVRETHQQGRLPRCPRHRAIRVLAERALAAGVLPLDRGLLRHPRECHWLPPRTR